MSNAPTSLDELIKLHPQCAADLAALKRQGELLLEIYTLTAKREHGEPLIGRDFKIAVEFLLDMEQDMRLALRIPE